LEKEVYDSGESSPDSFIQKLVERGHRAGEKDGSGIIAATFREDSRLEEQNVETVTGLILDVDGKFKDGKDERYEVVDPDWLLALLPYRGVAHTSYTHTPSHPKYRVILPLADEITYTEGVRLWFWIYEKTQRKIDPQCKNPGRMYFLPRCPKAALEAGWPWMRELHGPLLSYKMVPDDFQPEIDVSTYRRRKQQGAHTAPREANFANVDTHLHLEKLLELPVYQWAVENPTALNREAWRGLATNIAAVVVEDEAMHDEGAAAFHQISQPDEDRYNWGITEKTFRDALKSAQQYGPMTYATLVHNGAPEDVVPEMDVKSPVAHARRIVRKESPPKATAPAESIMSAGGLGMAPQTTCATQSDDTTPINGPEEEDDSILKHLPDEFLFDLEQSKWMKRFGNGEWSEPFSTQSMSQELLAWGLPRKKHDDFFAQIRVFDRRQALFDTQEHYVKRDTVRIFNTYRPGKIVPTPKAVPDGTDASTLPYYYGWEDIHTMLLNLAGGSGEKGVEYILDWHAAPLQSLKKGRPLKMGTALVLHGAPGSGKGTLYEIMRLLYGETNVISFGQEALDSQFNGQMVDKLYVAANEVMSSSNRSAQTANKIKPWVTDPEIPVERKHQDMRLVPNNFNIVFASNDDRPVIVEKDDRRFSVFKSGALPSIVGERLHEDINGPRAQVSAFYDHLLKRQVKVKYGQLFHTADREMIIGASLPSEERFVNEIISDGWYAVSAPWVENAPNGKIREPTVGESQDLILSSTMLEVYQDYCRRHSIKPKGSQQLAKKVKELIATSIPDRATLGGTRQRVWRGIPLQDADVIPLHPGPKTEHAPAYEPVVDDGDFGTGA